MFHVKRGAPHVVQPAVVLDRGAHRTRGTDPVLWRRATAHLTAALMVALALAGCGADWFGNEPVPTPTPDPQCKTRVVPPPLEFFDPFSKEVPPGRPPEVPPGWRWVVITLKVHAVSADDDVFVCVPFQVHVFAKIEGGPPPVIIDRSAPRPVPYDAALVTPWDRTYMVFAYDPESPRFAVPPVYEVTLIAAWDHTRDLSGVNLASLRCGIGISGVDVTSDYATSLTEGRLTARCNVKQALYL